MKKVLFAVLLVVCCLLGCSKSESDEKVVTVVCTPEPHGVILKECAKYMKEKGYTLNIVETDDYAVPNKSVDEKDADCNYFQHVPYFNLETGEYGYDLVNLAGIHIEPFGFYSKEISSVSELKENDKIVISSSVSDNGRILAILAKEGLITIKSGVDTISATLADIDQNKLNLQFVEVAPEMLYQAYLNNEGKLVAINGNYAITNGLNPTKDAVILEQADATNPYVNILACRSDNKTDPGVVALAEVLKSAEIRKFIEDTYSDGSVIPAE